MTSKPWWVEWTPKFTDSLQEEWWGSVVGSFTNRYRTKSAMQNALRTHKQKDDHVIGFGGPSKSKE